MCGFFGSLSLDCSSSSLPVYSRELLTHRGPDGFGEWSSSAQSIYLAHHRLSIIDLNETSNQPMKDVFGNVLVFNGEIYNYQALRQELASQYKFQTHSDTEVILALYHLYGMECVNHLNGMFAFALWDEKKKRLFCARDRFGIKPFYYAIAQGHFLCASEMKALLPFLPDIQTNYPALSEYLTFQYTLGDQTLFEGVKQLMPGHLLWIENGALKIQKYWDVGYQTDYDHSPKFFEEKLSSLLEESVQRHLISDVPIGSYLSGGFDSSLVTTLAAQENPSFYGSFHGTFREYPGYDEEQYAQEISEKIQKPLFTKEITAQDFQNHIEKVIYHLDVPVAGPGSFPQYMVSQLAGQHVKVVLGGQGGDELFGGYARYVIAYFEQTIRAAIEGTAQNGNFVVTPESIIPNLTLLREYKPLLQEFWREGLFGPLDERYFKLVDRSGDLKSEIAWDLFDRDHILTQFKTIFNNQDNVRKEAYFDKMTHFDFKCLLPALLHVEDRMSMAHGVESRVPFLDHSLVEFAATIPADIKFSGGRMKHLLRKVFGAQLPQKIVQRRDKMGFPVPLKEWFEGPLKDFVWDIFSSQCANTRGFYDAKMVLKNLEGSSRFSRKIWGLLSLELWYRQFHDQKVNICLKAA